MVCAALSLNDYRERCFVVVDVVAMIFLVIVLVVALVVLDVVVLDVAVVGVEDSGRPIMHGGLWMMDDGRRMVDV